MKRIFGILTMMIMISVSVYAQEQNNGNGNTDDVYYQNNNYDEQQGDNSGQSYQEFYDQLGPYGTWTNYPGYGYVWIPVNLPPDFSPYMTGGHWAYTEYGLTWVSDYEWGWATFHYGRWFQDPAYGWLWMPGYDWAPAWVVWGDYEGYYCWAPIGPGEYINGHHFNRGNHNWNFVPHEHICRENLVNYRVVNTVVMHNKNDWNIESKIKVINHAGTYKNSVFYSGPKAEEIEKTAGVKVARVSINSSAKPGANKIEGSHVSVYRPDMSRNPSQQAAPAKVSQPADIHHSNNTEPQRTAPQRTEPTRAQPQQYTPPSENRPAPVRQTPRQEWTPPRQSAPQREPAQQRPSNGGFVPHDMPQRQPIQAPTMPRQAPSMPSAPRGGGGGRH